MAETTWKQAVYDIADAYREAEGTEEKISIADLKEKVRDGGGKVYLDGERIKQLEMTSYQGDNPLTLGQDGTTFDANVLLKNGLTILNGVSGEDLTETYSNQSTELAEMMKVLKRKVSENRGSGEFVWKKYEWLSEAEHTVSFAQTATNGVVELQAVCNTADLSKVDASFFVGYTGTATNEIAGNYEINVISASKINFGGIEYTLSYEPTTQILSFNYATTFKFVFPNYSVIFPAQAGELLDYMVSDDENAYPNGTLHTDGYYYEKGESGGNVWKKYGTTAVTNPVFTLTRGTGAVSNVASTNIDLSKVTDEFFDGFGHQSAETTYFFYYENGQLYYSTNGTVYEMTYDAKKRQLIGYADQGTWHYVGDKEVYSNFLDYVVSDDETAYPDGGTQDGYWYERVSDGLTPELLGCEKIAVDEFVLSSGTVLNSYAIPHSLGEVPKMVILYFDGQELSSQGVAFIIANTNWRLTTHTGTTQKVGIMCVTKTGNTSTSNYDFNMGIITFTDTTIKFNLSYFLLAGITYRLITMA